MFLYLVFIPPPQVRLHEPHSLQGVSSAGSKIATESISFGIVYLTTFFYQIFVKSRKICDKLLHVVPLLASDHHL